MGVNLNTQNLIHIHNNTYEDILVIVSPNKDWLVGDLAFDIATISYSGLGLSSVVSDFPRRVRNLRDIWNLIKYVRKIKNLPHSGTIDKAEKVMAANSSILKQLENIENVIKGNSVLVKPGKTEVVSVKDVFSNTFRLVQYFSIIDSKLQKNPELFDYALKGLKESKQWGEYKKDKARFEEKTKEIGFIDFFISLYNVLDIINPSTFMSVFDFVSDMNVMIVTSSFEKTAFFKSNSSHSWCVNNTDIVRFEDGNPSNTKPNSGYKPFARIKGSFLLPGEYLEPNDALIIDTSAENIPELKNNLAHAPDPADSFLKKILKSFWRAQEGKIKIKHNATNNTTGRVMDIIFEKQYILIYHANGNLVLYENNGSKPTAIWSTNTNGKNAWRVYMQDDGNFCVYSSKGKCEWALWKNPPPDIKGGYIGFAPNNGKLGFYKNGSETAAFEIIYKKDTYLA